MARHVQHNLYAHRRLLTIRQIPISAWITLQPLIIQLRNPPRIHRNQLILLIPMADKTCAPLALQRAISLLAPEEAEAAIALGVDGAAVQHEALRDRGLHLGHGKQARRRDVTGHAVAAVHDERAAVHAGLRPGDEV